MSNTTVAVYGSLRKTLHNSRLLKEADYLGTTTIKNFKLLSMGSFPCITPSTQEDYETVVEVYSVTPEEFRRLDSLEGYPNFYDRREVDTQFGPAWIYFIEQPDANLEEVTSGDWLTYHKDINNGY